MSIKEFFKFNIKKIFIFIFLFLLFLFSWLFFGRLIPTGQKEPFIRFVMLFILAFPLTVIDKIFGTQGINPIWTIFLFIAQFIYLYLLSSIIYYLFYKKKLSF